MIRGYPIASASDADVGVAGGRIQSRRGTRDRRHTSALREPLRRRLVAEHLELFRGRTDEADALGLGGPREVSVLCQETVPGMNRVDSPLTSDGEDAGDVQVRADRLSPVDRPYLERLVGFEAMKREAVLVAVDGHRSQAELGGGPETPDGDFRSIGDKKLLHEKGPSIIHVRARTVRSEPFGLQGRLWNSADHRVVTCERGANGPMRRIVEGALLAARRRPSWWRRRLCLPQTWYALSRLRLRAFSDSLRSWLLSSSRCSTHFGSCSGHALRCAWRSSRSATSSRSCIDPADPVSVSEPSTGCCGRGSGARGTAGVRPCTSSSRRPSCAWRWRGREGG